MRAFAGCLALALAAVASTASAVTVGDFSLITISGSNAPNTNGRGQVTTPYAISQYETTNAQYVAFLNAVDTTGSNTLGLYSTFMTSNTSGGILFNSGAGPGSKYSVKSGYNQRPVTWTNWSSAARFVNWLVNGGTTNPSASTETGTYLMSGSAPYTRAVNAQIFLPSQDEWYKAAFYNSVSGSYNLWANGSAVTTPVATVSGSAGLASNQANFNNVNAPIGVTDTGIYTSSASPYQVYDMMGNVAEMTDTFSGSSYFLYGGSWQSLAAGFAGCDPAADDLPAERPAGLPDRDRRPGSGAGHDRPGCHRHGRTRRSGLDEAAAEAGRPARRLGRVDDRLTRFVANFSRDPAPRMSRGGVLCFQHPHPW
jgi:formylglycine-generating enzyme required for sulfatase activity